MRCPFEKRPFCVMFRVNVLWYHVMKIVEYSQFTTTDRVLKVPLKNIKIWPCFRCVPIFRHSYFGNFCLLVNFIIFRMKPMKHQETIINRLLHKNLVYYAYFVILVFGWTAPHPPSLSTSNYGPLTNQPQPLI